MQTVSFPKVVTVRSDGGGEFRGGKFGDLCRSRGIKQFTTADSPQFNGVPERALGLVETAAMTGRIHGREFFPGAQSPATESLWAEPSQWRAMLTTAQQRPLTHATSRRTRYGTVTPPPVVLLPFLKPG